MSNLEHLSYSSISTYMLCPRNWKFKYLDGIPTASSPALVFGSAFHATVEAIIKAKAAGETIDVAEKWAFQWAWETTKATDWGAELPEEYSNLGLRMLSHKDTVAMLAEISPMVDVDEAGTVVPLIERRVELHVPGVPIPVIGYIDIICSDGIPADFKTAARVWAPGKAEGELQPLFYLAALNQAGYMQNPTMGFRHYVFVKTKTPQVQVLPSRHATCQLFWLFGAIREVWKGIEAGVFPPNPSSWKCSDRWCDYWGICRGRR